MFPPAEKTCLFGVNKKTQSSCIARATKVLNISKKKMILWLYASTYSQFNILFKSKESTVKYCLLLCFLPLQLSGQGCGLKVLKSLKLVCQGRTGNCYDYILPKKQALKLCQCCNPYLMICYVKFERSYSRWG